MKMNSRPALFAGILLPAALTGLAGAFPDAGGGSLDTAGAATCVTYYRSGEYEKCVDCLTMLLPVMKNGPDSLFILQYLGYSYGMLGLIDRAKEAFKMGFAKSPSLQIDTLECPPNIGIIFNQVKQEQALTKIEAVKAPPPVVQQRKSLFFPIVMLTAAAASAGAGGYFFFSGNTYRQKYRSVSTPDQNLMDGYYRKYRDFYIASAASLGVSVVLMPISAYLLLRKNHPASRKPVLSGQDGHPALTFFF